ncbi:MAG: hypothetical protein K2W82_02630 [Candidatus Obscuribacterales bacterium]|nr:hypothetical protein [Candidatus Obscuribacterales bacterium]
MKAQDNIKKGATASLALVLLMLSLPCATFAAAPDNKQGDYFGRSTNSSTSSSSNNSKPVNEGPHPLVSQTSTPEQWFEAFDEYISYYRPSETDKYVINRSMNQESERVQQFCVTAGHIAKNYKLLATKLATMPVPASMPEVKTFKNLYSSWFEDSATLYNDMIRPRPAARTKEELESMLKEVTDRSESLKNSSAQLSDMDTKLRQKYSVHPPRYDDALFQYYNKNKQH